MLLIQSSFGSSDNFIVIETLSAPPKVDFDTLTTGATIPFSISFIHLSTESISKYPAPSIISSWPGVTFLVYSLYSSVPIS